MSGRAKRYEAFYTYLEPFLVRGNEVEIAQAKKAYRKNYKTEWRKAHRKEIKEITITWNKEEYNILQKEAKRHKQSVTRFVKSATMTYFNKCYIVPNQDSVNKTLQLIALTYNKIEELEENRIIPQLTSKKLQDELDQLERDIRITLFSPKTIEQILSTIIAEKPFVKTSLIQFIENLS